MASYHILFDLSSNNQMRAEWEPVKYMREVITVIDVRWESQSEWIIQEAWADASMLGRGGHRTLWEVWQWRVIVSYRPYGYQILTPVEANAGDFEANCETPSNSDNNNKKKRNCCYYSHSYFSAWYLVSDNREKVSPFLQSMSSNWLLCRSKTKRYSVGFREPAAIHSTSSEILAFATAFNSPIWKQSKKKNKNKSRFLQNHTIITIPVINSTTLNRKQIYIYVYIFCLFDEMLYYLLDRHETSYKLIRIFIP